MNTTYTLTEGNDALNRVLLMMRYDLGKTLDENVILEQPEEKSDTPYNKDLMRKYNLPSKTMTLEEFMEDFRETLTNPFMVGLEVALTSTGVGVTAVVAAYTALLAYDVYKGVTKGEWGWLDIIFDILGIVSSGVLSSTIKPIMQGAKGLKLNSLGEVLEYLSKTKIWSKIKPVLEGGITLLKNVSKSIEKTLLWISKKTGFKSLEYAGVSVETWVQKIVYDIQDFLVSSVKKTVKFLEPGEKVGVKTGLKRGLIAAGGITVFNLSIEAISKIKEKWDKMGEESARSPSIQKWLIVDNQNLYGKDISFKYKGVDLKKTPNGVLSIYDKELKRWLVDDVSTPEEIDIMIKDGLVNRTDLKFNSFEFIDIENRIYMINNKKYQAFGDGWKLKQIK